MNLKPLFMIWALVGLGALLTVVLALALPVSLAVLLPIAAGLSLGLRLLLSRWRRSDGR